MYILAGHDFTSPFWLLPYFPLLLLRHLHHLYLIHLQTASSARYKTVVIVRNVICIDHRSQRAAEATAAANNKRSSGREEARARAHEEALYCTNDLVMLAGWLIPHGTLWRFPTWSRLNYSIRTAFSPTPPFSEWKKDGARWWWSKKAVSEANSPSR